MLKDRLLSIKYTLDHRKSFLKVEKQLLGKNTIRGYIHDLDKVFLKLFLDSEVVSKLHRSYSKHHNRACTKEDFIHWECARFTKPDKPLNARETLYKFYPELELKILPILNEFGL